jgi:hypothetical protein
MAIMILLLKFLKNSIHILHRRNRMKKSDLLMVGIILTVLGACFSIFGAVTLNYSEENWLDSYSETVYPYRAFSLPLLFLGIVILAIGLGILGRIRMTKEGA